MARRLCAFLTVALCATIPCSAAERSKKTKTNAPALNRSSRASASRLAAQQKSAAAGPKQKMELVTTARNSSAANYVAATGSSYGKGPAGGVALASLSMLSPGKQASASPRISPHAKPSQNAPTVKSTAAMARVAPSPMKLTNSSSLSKASYGRNSFTSLPTSSTLSNKGGMGKLGRTGSTLAGGPSMDRSFQKLRESLPEKWKGQLESAGKSLLAAVTTYWRRGTSVDKWTRRGTTSTGIALGTGVVAVDPRIIPYGSMVKVEGVPGTFLAADCGSDVIKRRAVRKTARTSQERQAIVVDVFFATEKEGRAFDNHMPPFLNIKFFPPRVATSS